MEILGTIFLFLLHPQIWMSWAKKDYNMQKKGVYLFRFNKRLLNLINIIILTVLSIILVPYMHPENSIIRGLVHVIVIGLVVYYRFIVLQKREWLVKLIILFLLFYLFWYLNSTFWVMHLAVHKNTGQNNNIAIIIGLSHKICINCAIIFIS